MALASQVGAGLMGDTASRVQTNKAGVIINTQKYLIYRADNPLAKEEAAQLFENAPEHLDVQRIIGDESLYRSPIDEDMPDEEFDKKKPGPQI